MMALGQGSQRIEDALKKHFPNEQILRIDSDSTRQKSSLDKALEKAKTGKVKIKTKNLSEVENRDLILVDDMISTGGSLIKATQFLKKQKCKRIYVACTHALLMNDAKKKIKKAGVISIISTNTIPGKTSKVDISNTIAKAIM